MDRRHFFQITAASYLLGSLELAGAASSSKINQTGKSVTVSGRNYTWEWSQENDLFRLLDKKGRVMTSGKLQPAVVVQPAGQKGARRCTSGKPVAHDVKDDRLTVTYEGVNGSGKLSVTWRFEDQGLWLEPVSYETPTAEDVVALHYFAEGTGEAARPALENFYLILPGISESSGISPIVTSDMGVELTSWLGRGSSPAPGLLQQWGLPAHLFCGFHRNSSMNLKGAMTEHLSEAFCCGLAELPNGDLLFETRSGQHSLVVSFRSDLWGHLRGPGHLPLGGKLYWAVGPNYYEAMRRYYLGLVKAGVISKKTNSAYKNSIVVSPQFNTWGAEVALGKEWDRFDEATLNAIYEGFKASGMKAGMFVIDAKWEGKYGNLRHSPERFPHFEEILQRLRAEGYRVGLWAAFMRCEDPSDLGLTPAHMLRAPDDQPFTTKEGLTRYYILDFTQPEVQRALRDLAKGFVRRYKPDLVKFDFGYEIPSLANAAPQDMSWAGERVLLKGLEVVVKAMREENPDLVVMYYCLSPLFIDYFDLHSPDDLFMCAGEYDLEANRRFFFSSLLGEIGMPTYGSGGYDWITIPEIWFDSALIGTLGSLNSFTGDEQDSMPTPQRIAKYNGLTHVLRPTNTFTIEPVDADYLGPARGARSSSWARLEGEEVVAVALRNRRLDGRKGTGKFRDLVQTNASVVVASKTREGIARASKLAVVPFGDGELTLQRAGGQAGYAEAAEHCFGGEVKKSRLPIRDRVLRVPLRERLESGSPVEWIELDIHPE
jgi:hypothetical protein